jgi:hypothetical protein
MKQKATTIAKKPVFIGIPNHKGSIYVYGVTNQAVKYLKTTEAIAEYVGTKFTKELWTLVHKKEEATFDEPDPPDNPDDKADMERYKMLLKMKFYDERRYKQDKSKVFRIIMGQCSTAMKHKVQNFTGYKDLKKTDNVIGLLNKLKEFAYTTKNVQYEFWTMQASIKELVEMRQDPKESLNAYGKRFIAQLEVTEDVWGGKLVPMKLKGKATALQTEGRNKLLACLFLAGVDQS